MFAGMPRQPARDKIITINGTNSRIFLRAEDPEHIMLDVNANTTTGTVYLPLNAPIGKRFVIGGIDVNNSISNGFPCPAIAIAVGSTTLYSIGFGNSAEFYMSRTGWRSPYDANNVAIGSGAVTVRNALTGGARTSIAIGYGATASNTSTIAIGGLATASNESVVVGDNATGLDHGVVVGKSASAGADGVALGALARDNSKAGCAIGMYSKCERTEEFVFSADHLATMLHNWSLLDWFGDTANATPAEILLNGVASARAVLLNSSAYVFSLLAVARNNADDVTSAWKLEGVIKRGANAAATALVGAVTTTVIGADAGAATWAIAATADTTNGALIVTVTGEAAKTIRWNVRGDISELRF